MKTLYFNRKTLLGEQQNLISLGVNVPDNFSLTKEVEEIKEYKQKENEEGTKLFQKEVYREEVEEVLDGYDETIEETEKPLMTKVQKTDEEGNKLYLEHLYDGEGEVTDTFESTTQEDSLGNKNEPIMIEVQKTTEGGKPLYLKPRYVQITHQVFDHYEETTEETDEPIMLPVFIIVTKDVFKDVEAFSITEVISAKIEALVEESQYDSIIADLFLNEEDLDLEKTFANTGVGILQLPPSGYAQTKSIPLNGKAKVFQFIELDKLPAGVSAYVNTKKVIDGKVELASPVSNITIKFLNTTKKFLDVKSYCVVYKEEE